MKTVDRARGRWREILAQLGLDDNFLRNQHGPCPICGGRDRYRFDDRDGSGSFYCNQCGPGSGITLLMKLRDMSFAEAARLVDGIIGCDYEPAAPAAAGPSREQRLRKLDQVLDGARRPDIVRGYLQSRGLSVFPDVIRGHGALYYAEIGAGAPAMVAPVVGPDGGLQSVHRTFLLSSDRKKKLMTPVDTVLGGAVRPFQATDTLGVVEGIETAIAAHELFGVPTWAAISAEGMRSFVLPPGVEHAVIFADNDRNFVGQNAAYELAAKVAKYVAEVKVEIPPEPGTDWLDALISRRRAA